MKIYKSKKKKKATLVTLSLSLNIASSSHGGIKLNFIWFDYIYIVMLIKCIHIQQLPLCHRTEIHTNRDDECVEHSVGEPSR